MGQQAHVSSMDALDTFRARLIVYVGQARSALEEVTSDVTRVRNWIENDQRTAWETELRKRARVLDEARQALFSSRLSTFRGETSGEQMAVHRDLGPEPPFALEGIGDAAVKGRQALGR